MLETLIGLIAGFIIGVLATWKLLNKFEFKQKKGGKQNE